MRSRPLILALLFGALLPVTGVRAADPFYERLLREGKAAYDRGDFPNAVKVLRLANFGFLEEPELLAQGLCLLAICEARMAREDAFRETFLRLAEIEERFEAYSRANMPPETREAFESCSADLIPRRTLETTPAFAHLAYRREIKRLEGLSGRDRRRALSRLVEEYPEEVYWRLMLARSQIEERRWNDALQSASVVLRSEPANEEALLLRGLAEAGEEKWNECAADLEACGRAADNPRSAEALLRAYVEMGRWADAARFLLTLPDGIRDESSVEELADRVTTNQKKSAGMDDPALPNSLSDEDLEDLENARLLLDAGTDRSQLEKAYLLARQVANRAPGSKRAQFLTGEAAYRLSLWREAVAYLRSAGVTPEAEPIATFYMAVSLFESGEVEEAAELLRSCLPNLRLTPLVESYARRILRSKDSRFPPTSP